MRTLIVGAGSIGGYVGGRLARAGRDVTFLVRPARAARLRASGLQIVSPHGDLTLAPTLVTAEALGAPFDVVILAVKAFALDAALDDLAPAVGPTTMILPVLNGMKHMDVLAARFGASKVLGCAVKIMTTLDADGRVLQLAPLQDFAYGERDGMRSERVALLDAHLQDSGIGARLSPAIEREMWEKWIMLASVGALTCLMRGHVGEVASVPGGAALALAMLDECVAVVEAEGHPPSDAFMVGMRGAIAAPASTQTTSMYRDLLIRLPVEADQIVGDLLARAGTHGLRTPLLAAAMVNLSVYQASL
jgi:2-dehydropantoate 2-reductase